MRVVLFEPAFNTTLCPDPFADILLPSIVIVLFAVIDPVTVKLPVGILTVPYNVCISSTASPNWLEPVDNWVWFTTNVLIEAVPNTTTLPVIKAEDAVNAPCILVPVLTTNPVSGEIEADTEPEAIWDRFNPTIPDAGILNRLAPDPENEPEIPLVTLREPVISTSDSLEIGLEPVHLEETIPVS
jgi:hypothetical protein